MLDGFKKFILRGNVVDMAVGVVIGAAFGGVAGASCGGSSFCSWAYMLPQTQSMHAARKSLRPITPPCPSPAAHKTRNAWHPAESRSSIPDTSWSSDPPAPGLSACVR